MGEIMFEHNNEQTSSRTSRAEQKRARELAARDGMTYQQALDHLRGLPARGTAVRTRRGEFRMQPLSKLPPEPFLIMDETNSIGRAGLNQVLAERAGDEDTQVFADGLELVTDLSPRSIQAWVHRASLDLADDYVKTAYHCAKRGFDIGLGQIVEAGWPRRPLLVPWSRVENRPFLRVTHLLMLCAKRLGMEAEAKALRKLMGAINPDGGVTFDGEDLITVEAGYHGA